MPLRRCFISKSNGDYSTQIGLFLPQIAGEAVCPFSLLGCFSRCKAARRPVPRAMPAERWGRLRAAGPGPLRRPAPAAGPFAGLPRPRAPSPAALCRPPAGLAALWPAGSLLLVSHQGGNYPLWEGRMRVGDPKPASKALKRGFKARAFKRTA